MCSPPSLFNEKKRMKSSKTGINQNQEEILLYGFERYMTGITLPTETESTYNG